MKPSRASRSNARLAPPVPEVPRRAWAFAAAIVVIGLLAYANSLHGPFVFDDGDSIIDNQSIRNLSNVREVLSPERELPTAGRPLVNASFAVNYAIGGLGVTGYHVVNIAFHLANALLIFGIIRRTLDLPGMKAPPGQSLGIAFATALLWTLHPLNTEAVDYVTQRSELMLGFCYLLTMYAALRAATSAQSSRWSAIAITACAAGMACKESMATAPVMVLLFDRIFLSGSFTEAIRARTRLYLGLSATWLIAAVLMWSGPRIHSAGFSVGVSPWTYLLNQAVMISRYLRLVVWPRDLVANYGWPVPISLREAAPYGLLIVVLLAITAVALARRPKWGFLGAWFFVTLAPTSSIVPIATEVGAERRIYLPLIAVLGLLVLAVTRVAERRGHPGRIAALAVLALASGALATGTFLRNREYGSALVLARTSVERYPSSVAHHALATELILVGDHEQALVELQKALPGAPRAHYTLGVERFRNGQIDEAITELETFLREQPLLLEAVSARQLLGRLRARQKRWPEAIDEYRRTLTMNPSDQMRTETQAFLGEALYSAGRFDEAAAVYTEYLKARPDNIDALNVLGICLLALEKPDEAIGTFTRAVRLDPENGVSRRNLGNALFDRGDVAGAAPHAEEAARLRVDDAGAWDLLGRVAAVQGDLQKAQTAFARALRLEPGFSDAREHLQAVERVVASRRPLGR